MTKCLHDGSSEDCVCGHNMKDHETRYWEGARDIHFEEGYGCWGNNIGGINCISESEKCYRQKYDGPCIEILETSPDNREKLQAMELFKDTHLVKLELLSNATTIDSALNYIRNKQQQQQQKGLDLSSQYDQPLTGNRQTVF